MTTSHVHHLLPLHAGGDLDPAEGVRVEAHLATCVECRAQAAALADCRAWLAAAPEAPFSPEERRDLRAEVMAQVRREAARGLPRWKPLLGVAAALLLTLAGLQAWRPATAPQRTWVAPRVPVAVPDGADAAPRAMATAREIPRPPSAGAQAIPAPPASCPPQVARLQIPADPGIDDPPPLAAPTRIELQTDNPNIRIIWLAQATPEPTGTPSPKESL